MSKAVLKAYDAIAPGYESYSKGRDAYLCAIEDLVSAHLKPGMRLLDVGAGDGRRLAKISEKCAISEAVAIEPSAEMAKICRSRVIFPVHEVFAEDINTLNIGKFDCVFALWNVFGHIGSTANRLKALQNIHSILKPDGCLILDVNNRHNAAAYGLMRVAGRIVTDILFFDEKRGDAHYVWKIDGKDYQGFGHLFTPPEIEGLFKKAGFKVSKRLSVHYTSGNVSSLPYQGQLFYVITSA